MSLSRIAYVWTACSTIGIIHPKGCTLVDLGLDILDCLFRKCFIIRLQIRLLSVLFLVLPKNTV